MTNLGETLPKVIGGSTAAASSSKAFLLCSRRARSLNLVRGGRMPVTMTLSKSPPKPWGSPRPRDPSDAMGVFRDLIAQKSREYISAGNAVHFKNLANIKPTIDDDTEDDATGEARARLKAESLQAREAAEAARKAAVKAYFARIKSKTTVVDDLMDTEAAAVARKRYAAESKARKEAEQAEIKRENDEVRSAVRRRGEHHAQTPHHGFARSHPRLGSCGREHSL